jgi:K+-transporting ATPase ATPase B chain
VAEVLAEIKGKHNLIQKEAFKSFNSVKLFKDSKFILIDELDLKKGDIIFCEKGDIIPLDGLVIKGIASVDESAITGESNWVIREEKYPRNHVVAGSRLISDYLYIEITSDKGFNIKDKIISLVVESKRQKSPNEISLNYLLSALSTFYALAIISLKFFSDFSVELSKVSLELDLSLPVLIALFVCLVPTTVAALLNTIAISGMDRLLKNNVIAQSGRNVEAASGVDLFIVDKTGTITYGNRTAQAFIPLKGNQEEEFALDCALASFLDDTDEGKSIVILARKLFNIKYEALSNLTYNFIPFSAYTRISGIDIFDAQGSITKSIRKGSISAIKKQVEEQGGYFSKELDDKIMKITSDGGTPLIVSLNHLVIGIIELKDIVKPKLKEKFEKLRKHGITTLMVTGDNAKTAAKIAIEAGCDDFIADADPNLKLNLVKEAQKKGHFVAVAGDGINDAPALAQADVGICMQRGDRDSQAASNMIDLSNNPAKFGSIVEIANSLLMTRGALTTLSLSNDIAKYFAVIPAIFGGLYSNWTKGQGPLEVLDVMHLHSPQSAIISTMIFNVLMILLLIPIALKGVKYKHKDPKKVLRRNLLIFGLGGLLLPFIMIKLIDICISYMVHL